MAKAMGSAMVSVSSLLMDRQPNRFTVKHLEMMGKLLTNNLVKCI